MTQRIPQPGDIVDLFEQHGDRVLGPRPARVSGSTHETDTGAITLDLESTVHGGAGWHEAPADGIRFQRYVDVPHRSAGGARFWDWAT